MNVRIRSWLVTFVALALLVFSVYRIAKAITMRHLAEVQIKVTPFTIQTEDYNFRKSADGQLVRRDTVARQSNGSFVKMSSVYNEVGLAAGETVRTLRLADGRGYWVFDGIASLSTWPTLSDKQLAVYKESLLSPPTNCAHQGETVAGFELVGGHQVVKVTEEISGKKLTLWKAADLSCQLLQLHTEVIQPDGSLKLVYESRLVKLQIGEPDAALFEVPTSYAVLTPSEAWKREADKLGVPWTPGMEKTEEDDDAFLNSSSHHHPPLVGLRAFGAYL